MKGLFGHLALATGFLTSDQLQVVLEVHGRESRRRPVGEIATSLGFLTREQLDLLLEKQREYLQAHGVTELRESGDASKFDTERKRSSIVDSLVKAAIGAKASDLHLTPEMVPFLRKDRRLFRSRGKKLDKSRLNSELRGLLTTEQQQILDKLGQIDICLVYDDAHRLRGNIYHERAGLAATFRLIPQEIPSVDELHLPSAVAALTTFPQGLVLVTGPAGCGKSTSLAALIGLLNIERRLHVVSLEDPIEFVHDSKLCTVSQRQVGRDTETYASGLRAALREDPDVIVIADLRDTETIKLALTAAETGHLVMGTLHTSTAENTISRLLGAFAGEAESQMRGMLSESLRGVLCQRLIPAVGGGLVPLTELMFNVPAIANCIREQKLHQLQSIIQTGQSQHMMTREGSAHELMEKGFITNEVFERLTPDSRMPGLMS